MKDLLGRECQREVWRRARASLGLVDLGSEDFAAGGLGARVPGLSTRLLILPSDPERAVTEFDEDLWQWWLNLESRVEGHKTEWGYEHRATLDAIVRHDRASDDPWQWNRYLALHRTGAMEFALGSVGARKWNEARIFFLIAILGRTWASVSLYRSVIERLVPEGPWELTLAMKETQGSYVGNVAEGWAEPQNLDQFDLSPCVEPNVLIRFELDTWPRSDEEVNDLALALGGRIEDAWGIRQRRFLARRGDYLGRFDVSRL